MIELDELYFKWLMEHFDDTSPALERLCWMLGQNVFQRRVGNDVDRAIDGINLRKMFLDDYSELDLAPHVTNDFAEMECSWLEMLIALATQLDFLYDGGVKDRFLELITNMGLLKLLFVPSDTIGVPEYDEIDQDLVDAATSRVDNNRFGPSGEGGLFPLTKPNHPDQREVEIWDQHSAYFLERLEGVMWTSTK